MGRLITSEVWTSLEVAPGGRGLVRTRIAPDAPVDIYVAVEQPNAVRLVQFGLAGEHLAESLDIPQARGIEVKAVPTASGSDWGYAQIRLVDRRYVEIFTSLADDLVEHVSGASTGTAAIDRLADRLRRWESFLKVVEPDGLGQERRAGLYGELWALREKLLPVSPSLAVSTWVGPQGAHQDFQASSWALEIKTSRTKEPVAVRISGERQLDGLGLAFLGLGHIGLEQRRNSGETLPEIVTSIRIRLANTPSAETFEAQLLSAGYLAIHEPQYLSDGYVVRFSELFRVEGEFPRITEKDLKDGVGDVAYSVAVAALGGYRVDWSFLADLMRQDSSNG